MNRARQSKSVVFLVLIFIIILVVSGILFLSLRTDTVAENLKKDQVIKILLVLDDGQSHALTTDVFVYYPVSEKGAIFDILGNTGAIYESLGRVDRIDAIYNEKGIDVYRSEIEKLIGMSIPYSIVLSTDNFGHLTDLLGGLKVFIPSPVDAKGSDGQRWLLPNGSVNLDGDKIQTFVEYILDDETDEDREERCQNAVIAFLSAIKDNRAVMFSKKNFTAYSKYIDSNMDENGLLRVFDEISRVDTERLIPQTITGSTRIVDGKKLLFPYYDAQLIKDVVKQTMNSLVSENDTMNSRVYVIEIQNGTSVQGLARNTAALLQSVGYDILGTSNADSSDKERTVIINHIGNNEVAKALGDFIHCTNIVDEEIKPEESGLDSAANVDFTIILGGDFDGRYVRIKNKEN